VQRQPVEVLDLDDHHPIRLAQDFNPLLEDPRARALLIEKLLEHVVKK